MDATKAIRALKLIILFLFAIHTPMQIAAEAYTLDFKESDALSKYISDIPNQIISKQGIEWGEMANVDVNKVTNADTLYLSLKNEYIELHAIYRNEDNNCSYTHYESSDKSAQAYVSILENNIYANLSTSFGNYHVHSISDNQVIAFRYESDISEEPENISYADVEDISEEDVHAMRDATTPVLRVLFLYTNAALNLMGSYQPNVQMRQVVYNYINTANESFSNSNVNARMQLAYIGPTDYNESSHTWSNALNHFYNTNDGYMDEVHTLRNKYAADVCVLFLDKSDYCGEAKTIKANASTAFCLVNPIYGCNYKFTAVHEIGHLVGCRHNRSIDSSLSPYVYGHGYIHYVANYPASSWRTMMSYDNSCNTGCGRIPYWSNPNVYYNGVVTGTTTYENNARVWNERAGTVSAFRNRGDTLFYTSSNNNTLALFESIEAETRITTSGGFEVQSGQIVEMRAPTIRLTANTHIKSGATFLASASTNGNINTYPQFEKRRIDASVKDIPVLETNPSPTSPSAAKVLREGQLYIIRDGRTYNAQGMRAE